MQLASNRLGGAMVASPDVCLTPLGPVPVPVPYTNVAYTAAAVGFSTVVVLSGGNALHLGTVLAMSTGDEPGVVGGVLSGTTRGLANFTAGCPKVFFEGLPAIGLTSTGLSNQGNVPGVVTLPSPTNTALMLAPWEERAEAKAADPERIRQLLCDPGGAGRGELLAEGIGYLAIDVFSASVPPRAHGAIRQLLAQGMELLVLDLRDNPGGEVRAALELLDDFLPAGAALCHLTDAEGDVTTYRARRQEAHAFGLIALVNRGTASSAELVAGCLQWHGRAIVAGERTYGKGVVQALLGDGACPIVATCSLPGGEPIEGEGIKPCVALAQSPSARGEGDRGPEEGERLRGAFGGGHAARA
jgi:carboxyl-terminal processing protease